MDIDKIRKFHLAIAEFVDAWRLIPRAMVACYGYLLYMVTVWYINLEPYVIDNCKAEVFKDCIIDAPTTQHSIVISALVGIAGAIFGFYAKSGRDWSIGIPFWKKEKDEAGS